MSSEFVMKKKFKLKKMERPICVRNMDEMFNKKGLIEYRVKINIYYQRHRKKIEINVIRGQKWNVILEIPWLVCYNSEIDWKTKEVKMTRYSEKYGKQQMQKQKKLG